MLQPPSPSSEAVPRWVIALGSLVIAAHLVIIAALVLAAPSGPWATAFDTSMATPPQFAQLVNQNTAPTYLRLLRLTHNYHFPSNRPGAPGVYFEVRLKDEQGKPLKTVKIPDESTNFWVRHRQAQLARALADDQPIRPIMGESVAAPNQRLRTEQIWEMTEGGRSLQLRTVPEHLIPRDRPVFRPSEWTLLLARSYVRYLCRAYGATSAELIRHTQEAIPPAMLFMGEPQAGAFDDLVANFGEFSR